MADNDSPGASGACPEPLSDALATVDKALRYHASRLGPVLERLMRHEHEDASDDEEENEDSFDSLPPVSAPESRDSDSTPSSSP